MVAATKAVVVALPTKVLYVALHPLAVDVVTAVVVVIQDLATIIVLANTVDNS